MQWSPGPGGGFSAAPVEKLPRPIIAGGPYGYEALNVLDASRQPHSLLHAVERLIRTRRECPEIRPGSWTCETETASVFTIRHSRDSREVLALTNLTPEPVVVRRRGGEALLDELTSDAPYPPANDRLDEVALGPWGYRWFRAHAVDRPPPTEGAAWKEAS